MNLRPPLAASLLAALLALAPAARARSSAPADHALGCDTAKLAGKPWTAAGLGGVTAATAAKFKLLNSISSPGAAGTLGSDCSKWPSIGAKAFIKPSGGGGITRADIVVATEDVTVYRAYSDGPFKCSIKSPAAKLGSWWALSPFPSSKDAYRKATAVCSSWNDFSKKVVCTLEAGTVIAVGPSQSADCAADNHKACPKPPADWKDSYRATADHQVFINTYGRPDSEIETFLTKCRPAAW
jgi:hypothetical protein